MGIYQNISITEIVLWEDNPRGVDIHKKDLNQRDVLDSFFNSDKKIIEMKNLARDIISNGLLPVNLICIWSDVKNNKLISIDGNRRIVSLKLLLDPSLLSHNKNLFDFYTNIQGNNKTEFVNAYVTEDYEEAINIAEKVHLGEDEGRGQKNWIPKEKDFFKDKVKKETRDSITSSYLLRTSYPSDFEAIIERLKSSSVDRIINYKIVKNTLNIKDFSQLNEAQQKQLLEYLTKAEKYQAENDIRISRFTTAHAKKILDSMTFASDMVTKVPLGDVIKTPVLKFSTKNKRILQHNTFNISSLIENKNEFTSLNIIKLDPKTFFDEDKKIFLSTNSLGNYLFKVTGLIGTDEIDSQTITITVTELEKDKLSGVKEINNTALIKIHGHEIVIPGLNNIVSELSSFSFQDAPNMITLSLRFITEEAIRILFNSKGWSETFKNLTDTILHFKNKIERDTAIQNIIETKLNLSSKSVSNFLSTFNANTMASILNHLSHTSTLQVNNKEILDLSQTKISTILTYISVLINNN